MKEIRNKESKKRNNKYPYITSLGFVQVIKRYVLFNHQIILPPTTRNVESKTVFLNMKVNEWPTFFIL